MSSLRQHLTRYLSTKSHTACRHKLALLVTALAFAPFRMVCASESNDDLDLWMHRAPLTMVVEQIAMVSGKSVEITGVLEGRVTGRFSGSLTEALSSLTASQEVLFDLQGNTLFAISNRAWSNVSFALPEKDSADSLLKKLQEIASPGNSVAVLGGKVTVSGHPGFVKRIVRKIGSGQFPDNFKPVVVSPVAVSLVKAGTPEIATEIYKPSVAVETLDAELNNSVSIDSSDNKLAKKASSTAEVDLASTFASANSEPESVRRIRSVTDIPGFSTF